MASEDSDQLVPGLLPVHRLSDASDLDQTVHREVSAGLDHLDAARELHEVLLLRRSQGVLAEERDHRLHQVRPPTNDVSVQVLTVIVVPRVAENLTHTEELTKLVKAGHALLALRYCELVSNLETSLVAASARPALLPNETDREASFPVYKTDHPATELDQPFLLIFRTRHVVTVGIASDDYE